MGIGARLGLRTRTVGAKDPDLPKAGGAWPLVLVCMAPALARAASCDETCNRGAELHGASFRGIEDHWLSPSAPMCRAMSASALDATWVAKPEVGQAGVEVRFFVGISVHRKAPQLSSWLAHPPSCGVEEHYGISPSPTGSGAAET